VGKFKNLEATTLIYRPTPKRPSPKRRHRNVLFWSKETWRNGQTASTLVTVWE